MKKIIIIMFIMLIGLSLYAEEAAKTETTASATASASPFNLGGSVGAYSVDGVTYTRFRLNPEITLGKLGIGLDFDLLIDSDGGIRDEDWDEAKDYINKFLYVRWAKRGDPFYLKAGAFSDYSLGQGLIMKNYTNMLNYPNQHKIGVQVGAKIAAWYNSSLEVFSSDIVENDLLAARYTIKPLSNLTIPILSGIKLGATYVTDREQHKGLLDTDDDNYYDIYDDFIYDSNWHDEYEKNRDTALNNYLTNNPGTTEEDFDVLYNQLFIAPPKKMRIDDIDADEVVVYGVDYDLPLIKGDIFNLGHYAEYAKIDGNGAGLIFPGFRSKFSIFHARLEMRHFGKKFTPAYYDNIYDQNRITTMTDSTGKLLPYTKEASLATLLSAQGWFGSIEADIFKIATFTVQYEDMFYEKDELGNEDHVKSIWGELAINTNLIPKLSEAKIRYSQINEDVLLKDLRTPNTIIIGKAGYEISPGTALVYNYQETYRDANNDGEIKGKNEIIKNFGIGVEFKF